MSNREVDAFKEAIKFNTELIRIFTVVILALATGVSSLYFNDTNDLSLITFKRIGSIAFIIFVILTFVLILGNKRNIKKLKNG